MAGDYSSKRVYGIEDRYEHKMRCRDCGHTWKKFTTSVEDPGGDCPACKKARKKANGLQDIIASGRAPAFHGVNMHVKAMDVAAEMIMQDQGMTDLKGPTDCVRPGDTMTVKLPPKMQAAADAMFSPKKQLESVGMGRQAGLIARSALAGGYSPSATGAPDPISAAQAPRMMPTDMAKIINPTGRV